MKRRFNIKLAMLTLFLFILLRSKVLKLMKMNPSVKKKLFLPPAIRRII